MRKMFSFMAISADGYHADAGRGLAWQTFGQEFADYSVEQLDEVDTLVFGRTTYTELAAYWTGDLGANFDPRIADRMNALDKLVVSRTLGTVSWGSSSIRLTSVDQLAEFKHTPGKSIAILGSSALASALLRAHLVDEIRLMVNDHPRRRPETVRRNRHRATGKTRARPFQSGNVLLYYRPAA